MIDFRSIRVTRDADLGTFTLSAHARKGLYLSINPRTTKRDYFELEIPAFPEKMINKMQKILDGSPAEELGLWEKGLVVHFDSFPHLSQVTITFFRDDKVVATFALRDVEFLRVQESIRAYHTI